MQHRQQHRVACLAPGASLPGLLKRLPDMDCIAVNSAFRLRPDAVALAAQDRAWWTANPDAMDFAGRKFSCERIHGVERMDGDRGLNSGLLALMVAERLGYTTALLVGYDMHGDHYHEPHPAPLKNPGPATFDRFARQFRRHRVSIDVWNVTPNSALTVYPAANIEDFA